MKGKSSKQPFEHSFIILCPVCNNKTFNILQRTDNIPHFGEVLETFAHCDSCKYKTSDILPLEKHKATKQNVLVSKNEMEYRVVKSKFCMIKVPELGLKIDPGPDSEGYITNVEGLLDRIADFLKSLKVLKPKEINKIEKLIEKIKSAKEGKIKLTIIFSDKTGNSRIIKE